MKCEVTEMFWSVCASAVFSGMPLTEALPLIREAGAEVYEIWGWWDEDIDALAQAQCAAGLKLCAMCTKMVPLNDPARREEYIDGLRESIAVARRLGCNMLITQVGQAIDGVSRKAQHESIVDGLRACAPVLEAEGMTLVFEPLNVLRDHIGYYLAESAEAFEIAREVGSPNVKVLYDVYHQQVTEGNLIENIRRNTELIGHIHMAGVPGRHEPLDGEINYPAVLSALKAAGYCGAAGLEYFPTKDAVEGIRETMEKIPL